MPEELDRRRILVIDDEERMVRFIRMNLEHDGFQVSEAFNGKQAVQKLRDVNPDLILLDLVMPAMDGRQLAACLQGSPKLKDVPIIFLTARITKEEVGAVGGRIGDFPFLAKPIVVAELISSIRRHLP